PCACTSALSTKLIPASRARWMIRIESSWSVLPHAPNIIAPRQRGLTSTPVRPSVRSSIMPAPRPDDEVRQVARAKGHARDEATFGLLVAARSSGELADDE